MSKFLKNLCCGGYGFFGIYKYVFHLLYGLPLPKLSLDLPEMISFFLNLVRNSSISSMESVLMSSVRPVMPLASVGSISHTSRRWKREESVNSKVRCIYHNVSEDSTYHVSTGGCKHVYTYVIYRYMI